MVNGRYQPIKVVEGKNVPKEISQWTPNENKRAHYDVRAKNIRLKYLFGPNSRQVF